jgi:hypothetical protein
LTMMGLLLQVDRWPFRALGYVGALLSVSSGGLFWAVKEVVSGLRRLASGPH